LLPEWDKHYRNQIPSAYKLLKKFAAAAIIAALQDRKAWNIYSLRAPHLIPLIEAEQKVYENKQAVLAQAQEPERGDTSMLPRENKAKPNLRDRLKELE
jgi:hypothetical protein